MSLNDDWELWEEVGADNLDLGDVILYGVQIRVIVGIEVEHVKRTRTLTFVTYHGLVTRYELPWWGTLYRFSQ